MGGRALEVLWLAQVLYLPALRRLRPRPLTVRLLRIQLRRIRHRRLRSLRVHGQFETDIGGPTAVASTPTDFRYKQRVLSLQTPTSRLRYNWSGAISLPERERRPTLRRTPF